MYNDHRTNHLRKPPPGAQLPTIPSSPQQAYAPYSLQVTPPVYQEANRLNNPWDSQTSGPSHSYITPRPRVQSMQHLYSSRPQPPQPPFDSGSQPRIAFPEPQFYRPPSYPPSTFETQQRPTHHHSRSDLSHPSTSNLNVLHHNPSVSSLASSYNATGWGSGSNEGFDDDPGDLVRGLSDLSLQSEEGFEEGLRRFQAGELPEVDQEWHRLVPEEAREALGKQEVQRQSVLFEVVKSEREYVADLEAVQQEGIAADYQEPALTAFIQEVFGNLNEILSHHNRILAALFARQRDQHPLIQSVADLLLDTTLKSEFRSAYETYIKHYPLAESHHRKQLKQNRAYEIFCQSTSNDPRIRKRDLITFLSRPVTRLPRLNLLLEQILKLTNKEYDHPDLETLPIITGILKACIKSTQPGIEAAESKVKFWALCESLVFQKGEIIDMDLYDDSRTLVYTGPVIRRAKSDTGFSEKWTDLVAALLDNYLLLMREEKRPNGSIKRLLMSRPMPLSFLRLGSFDSPPDTRKEKSEEGRLLDSFRYQNVPIYPFTIYHAASRSTRRYTLYVTSETLRKKWYNAFVDAIGVHRVRQESNMWFSPQVLTDDFFRITKTEAQHGGVSKVTGRIVCAVPFMHGSRRFLVVGCAPGIYIASVNSEQYRWVLQHKNPTSLSALTTLGTKTFNRLIVHADSMVMTYSLDILARIAVGSSARQTLEASLERIGGSDANIVFCKHIHLGGRALLVCATKRRLSSSMTLQVLEAVDTTEQAVSPARSKASSVIRNFRGYGDPGYVPKDAYDIVALAKTIGICTSGGIVTADPTNLAKSSVAVVPDLSEASNNEPMENLKSHLEGHKPLGFVRVDPNELLVVYDELGCYINKHGVPTRRSGYIKWETKAFSYAHRNGHVLLISPEFIEVRNITTGRIVQVIEGQEIRLLYSDPYTTKDDPVLVAMRGSKDDKDGVSEKIVELMETEEISALSPISPTTMVSPSVWDDWDM
ncbi:unnamed protein product [Cyclocybe aegerita]|uniref:Rho1 guanine nucleotide exchange factor 1 n=1 Tax=Cyclocybe aegerita TaxID=1973307 RepID=A0A8S0WNY8_CYCAE|nr:unnamed protein product [Cyclocybe aegerita]